MLGLYFGAYKGFGWGYSGLVCGYLSCFGSMFICFVLLWVLCVVVDLSVGDSRGNLGLAEVAWGCIYFGVCMDMISFHFICGGMCIGVLVGFYMDLCCVGV